MDESKSAIWVELTDESELHCLKVMFRACDLDEPLEIFLHTTQAIKLIEKLSLAVCERHRRDSALLLEVKSVMNPDLVAAVAARSADLQAARARNSHERQKADPV